MVSGLADTVIALFIILSATNINKFCFKCTKSGQNDCKEVEKRRNAVYTNIQHPFFGAESLIARINLTID